MLPPNNFVRIHRATIINIEGIEKVDKWFQRSYKVKIKGISEGFEISRRYYSKIRELYGGE
jgi:DNA-binding LytR/AlgR family response regulator